MEELIGVLNYTDLKVNSSGGGGDLSNYYTKGETDSQIKKSIDKIKVPTKVSELSNDAGYLTQHQDISNLATKSEVKAIENKIPAAYELPTASATTLGGVKVGSGLSITNGILSATGGGGVADSVEWDKVQNKPNFANVAISGNYNDLINQPTIPSVEGLASEAYVNEKVAAIKVPSLDGYAKTADLAQVAKTGSYNDLADKPTIPSTTGLASTKYVDDKVAGIVIPTVPTKVSAFENDKGYLTEHQSLAEYAKKTEIPAPYTLPTASTSTLGGVKVDGSTITIADGVISAKGGSGGSEPDAYIKDALVNGNTLILTKKDDTEVVFTPTGSGGDIKSYSFPISSLTVEEIANLQYCVDNPTKVIFTINDIRIQNVYKNGNNWYFIGIFYLGGSRLSIYSIRTAANSTTIIGTSFSTLYSSDTIITQSNANNYLSLWQVADSLEDSNLYNARELVILLENSDGKCFSYYYNLSCSFDSAYDQGGLGMYYANKNFFLQLSENRYGLWNYNGSEININLDYINNYRIYYKT